MPFYVIYNNNYDWFYNAESIWARKTSVIFGEEGDIDVIFWEVTECWLP